MCKSMSKSELARQCGVSLKKVRSWCNEDFYEELQKIGYQKKNRVFTPKQTKFLKENIVEFSDN